MEQTENQEVIVEEAATSLNSFIVDKINESFIMGMNYARLRAIEASFALPPDEQVGVKEILTDVGIYEEATLADLPTKH
jgi:hypothetical protein